MPTDGYDAWATQSLGQRVNSTHVANHTTRSFPSGEPPAVYSRGNGQATLVHSGDGPTASDHPPLATLMGMQLVGALRRKTTSAEAIRAHYWYVNPALREDAAALDALCEADALVGARGRLTLAEAQGLLAHPPAQPPRPHPLRTPTGD